MGSGFWEYRSWISVTLIVVVETKIHITESGSLLIIPVFLLDLVSLVGSWLDKDWYLTMFHIGQRMEE